MARVYSRLAKALAWNTVCECYRRRSRAGYDPADPRAVATPYLSAQGHNLLDVKFCESP